MPMKPHAGESESDFMSRCVPDMMDGRDNDQAVAACLNMWRERSAGEVVHRDAVGVTNTPLEYVLSDGTLDRFGTVISPNGWELDNFRKNPIAFFNHNRDFPVGRWENVRVEGGKLVGKLKLAKKGTSARIDEIASLIEQGILRGVSIGMHPKAKEPLKRADGQPIAGAEHYTKQELLEASVVGVPGNANALLAVARGMHISDETVNLVFGEQATRDKPINRGINAGHGTPPPIQRSGKMPTISERVEAARTTFNQHR